MTGRPLQRWGAHFGEATAVIVRRSHGDVISCGDDGSVVLFPACGFERRGFPTPAAGIGSANDDGDPNLEDEKEEDSAREGRA